MRYALIYADWREVKETYPSRVLIDVTISGCVLPDPTLYSTVFSGETDDPEALPEELFERFNYGDRAGLPVRSMSVGDIVAFEDGRALVCAGAGWKDAELPIEPEFSLSPLDASRLAHRARRKRELDGLGQRI